MPDDRYDDEPERKIDLSVKFPDMRPITRVPSLSTVNGIGTMLIGSRDRDDETGTYVKTQVFAFVFLPLMAVAAYRVFDAPGGGWYFLGKVPLSGFARAWNKLMLLLALGCAGAGGWFAYTGTADYKAGAALARADKLAAEGKGGEAAAVYRDVMLGKSGKAGEAKQRLAGLLDEPPSDLAQAAGLFEVALDLHRREQLGVGDLFGKAVALVNKHQEADPAGALALLETVAPLAPQPADQLAPRRRLLERLVAKSPDDVDLASRLAVVCAQLGDDKRCVALLQPVEERLGDREGAAVLGRVYAGQGKYEAAKKLLSTYLDARLPRLRAAEQQYASAVGAAQARIASELDGRTAEGFDFARFNAAAKPEQSEMIGEYYGRRMRDDAGVREAGRKLSAETAAVPAALDLGAVRLQLAQAIQDPAARQAELKKAEETFLAVQGLAGDSDRYRMNLGQVYYWLGKPDEGRKLFDEFLEAHNRASDHVGAVATVLREVGATSDARKLLEEAYTKEPAEDKKQVLAMTRAVMYTDLDDKIAWLGRARQSDPEVKATLAHSRGMKAAQDGKDDEAARLYREALAEYARMPENETVLNNSAGVHFSLYQLTQDREQFRKGADNIDRAVALRPRDSILLGNAANVLLETVARDVVGDAIDLKAIKRGADLGLFPYLYADQAGKDRRYDRLRAHPGLAKAKGYFDRLLVLAPKRASNYGAVAWLCETTRDLDGQRAVARRMAEAKLDLDQYRRQTLDFYAGKEDEKRRDEWAKAEARQREVMPAARKAGGATLAVASSSLATTKLGAAVYGLPVEADEVVQLAEEADAAAPSSATKAVRIEALLFRAHRSLERDDKAYRDLAERTARSLGYQVLSWAVSRPGPLRDRALANADLKQALALKLAQEKAFPTSPSVVTWAYLSAANPAEAAGLAKRIRADEVGALRQAVARAQTPLSATGALEAYYRLLLDGKATEAEAALREGAKKGIPLPAPN